MAKTASHHLGRLQRLSGIYAIVGDSCSDVLGAAHAALDAGVRVVQYRRKSGVDRDELRGLRVVTRDRDALLLLNDDWQAAREWECDGVHLGPGDDGFDMPSAVRAAWPDGILGLSCGSASEAMMLDRMSVDYIGVGPVYATHSKSDAGQPIGISGLLAIAAKAQLPVCAIGGISMENIAAVRKSGVAMAAVISAIASAREPRAAARELVRLWEQSYA
ncbi:MAG: thiamine phosphate synthase [Vulcanimicrobiaceae bacterium]